MTDEPLTYDLALLEASLAKWRNSPALRALYGDIFREICGRLRPGATLELGSGIGVIKEFLPGVVTSDIAKTRFVDRAVSAYAIGAEGGPWHNLVAFDVLHHLREPFRFFASAATALAPEGRLVLVEPAGTPLGRWFYRLFHHEPCRPDDVNPPFAFASDDGGGFANMGMGQALFHRHRAATGRRLAALGLRIALVRYRDVLGYPATGGFSRRSLLPAGPVRALLAAEGALPQPVLRLLGLRMLVVLDKARG
jgi:hypothetical protein